MSSEKKETISNYKQELSKEYSWCVLKDISGFYKYKRLYSKQDLEPIASVYGYFSKEENAINAVRYLNDGLREYIKTANDSYIIYKNRKNNWVSLYVPGSYFYLPKGEVVQDIHYFSSEYDANEFKEAKELMSNKSSIVEAATEKSAYKQIADILKIKHFSDDQIRQIQMTCLSFEKENAKTSLRKAAEKWAAETNNIQNIPPVKIFEQGAFYAGRIWKDISDNADGAYDAVEQFDNWVSANCREVEE